MEVLNNSQRFFKSMFLIYFAADWFSCEKSQEFFLLKDRQGKTVSLL